MKIISKKPHHSGYEGFEITTEDGKEWSILNFADSMKNHPFPEGIYLGWEAYNGNTDEIIRANTYQEIENQIINLTSPPPSN